MAFNLYIWIACLLLLCLLVYQEIKRPNKHWLGARLFASLLAVAMLALLIVPINVNQQSKQQPTQLNIISAGYHADGLAQIPHQKYFLEEALASTLKRKANFIPDLAYHLAAHPEINNIAVYGYGLTGEQLKQIKNIPLEFHPAEKPSGVIACHWKDELKEGETLVVQGQYRHHRSKAVNLKLIGFGKTLDSTQIIGNSTTKFSFQHQIKQKGRSVLQLVALQGKDTLSQEPIPVQTLAKTSLKIVVLGSSPGFEYNFLKKWLYENQYALALRNRISKDKYSIEFLNRSNIDINRLSTQLLQKEDVLLLDQQEFESISASEKQAIKQAVAQGLGLIILAQEPNTTEPWLKSFNLAAIKKQEKINQLQLTSSPIKLAALPEQAPFSIGNRPDQQPLVLDGPSAIAVQKLYGKGKIVTTTLSNSYQWRLTGNQQDYALYWSSLLEAAARNTAPNYLLQTESNIPRDMSKLNFSLSTPSATIPAITNQQQSLSSQQNMLFSNRWQFQYWPLQSGWHQVAVDGQKQHFFVFGKENWQALSADQRIKQNIAYALSHPSPKVLPQTTIILKKTISKWWFFIAFVLATGFLWFESRLYNQN
ncbi:hypothetical protein [Pedobacter chitinilyticus]|uniref:Aerotolerance regulator N-terminal domain-containing protein n=1 Tax=Pedobacter chitinilyticus TaxID=2233776 RepID=A0A451GDD1_9SPHI|nr:hypothetical protein [Pedobacter chitinilyticus]RWU10872.1 hypothetical protein DPV69_05950 [Pedobacter chitinilyticus]